MRYRTRARAFTLDFSYLAFGRGADEWPSSPPSLELLKNSHLNSTGKDLFDLLRAIFFALAPCAARNCVREHNREPAVSNVHLYGYYHGPWGGQGGWVAHSQDRSALSLSGLVDFFKENDSVVNQSMGSEQISALISRRAAPDQPEPANKDKQ